MKIDNNLIIDNNTLTFYASFVLTLTSKLLNGNAEILKTPKHN